MRKTQLDRALEDGKILRSDFVIYRRLGESPRRVGEVIAGLDMSRPTLHRALHRLMDAKLVKRRRMVLPFHSGRGPRRVFGYVVN